MHTNDMLEYADKIIDAFKIGTFLSEHLKKSDNAAYDYVFKDVKNFIQKIKLMEEKINLSLFEDVFWLSSPVDYVKMLINTSPDENKKIVAEIKDRILDLKDDKRNERKRKRNANETLNIIKEILDYNKNAQNLFLLPWKGDRGKLEPKTEESIAERTKLRRDRIAEVKREEENINSLVFKYYFCKYQNASDMYKNLRKTKGKKMKVKYI